MYTALSQTLLKLAAPGVPDIYQGCELWNLSLVDPDNRRPVDFARRRTLLAETTEAVDKAGDGPEGLVRLARDLVDTRESGRIKLYLIQRVLDHRRRHPELFHAGAYRPLAARGPRREHVVAFAREHATGRVVVVAPRFFARLGGDGPPLGPVWDGTWIEGVAPAGEGPYRNLLTGERHAAAVRDGQPVLELAQVLATFPVAVLEEEGVR
jgi:(1->4)-alpha-D-glucan 1-alpha-D-glucosylmutase